MSKTRATKANSSRGSSKTARLAVRITQQQKQLIERAAAYEGRSVSDFVVHAIAQAARSVIQNHEVLRLNPQESQAFVDCLLNPPVANEALRRAAKQYRRTVRSQ
jgi:uncharacterized protein (DUF1778 family)